MTLLESTKDFINSINRCLSDKKTYIVKIIDAERDCENEVISISLLNTDKIIITMVYDYDETGSCLHDIALNNRSNLKSFKNSFRIYKLQRVIL